MPSRIYNSLFPWLILFIAAFFCYGGFKITRLGFYNDDWILLSYLHLARPGFFSRLAALVRGNDSALFRPFQILSLTTCYVLFGLRPLLWQGTLLLINVGLSFLICRLLEVYGVAKRLALIGGVIFLAFPNKDATMFWPVVMANSLALGLWLLGYLLHLQFIKTGRKSRLGMSAGALLISLATYEQCIFLFPLWLITPFPASARTRRGFAVAAAVTAFFSLYKFIFVPYGLHVQYNKTIILSWMHFVEVYWNGLKSTGDPLVFSYIGRSIAGSFKSSPVVSTLALVWPLAILAAQERRSKSDGRRLAVLGAGMFILGYLPIALSDYMPMPFNHMNRINEVPMVGVVLLLICGLQALGRAKWVEPAACLGAGLLLVCHMGFAQYWVEAYRRQLEVKDLVMRNLASWPRDKILLLLLPERAVAHKAPVFIAHWDISGAARIWTQDRERDADVIAPSFEFGPDGVQTHRGFSSYDSLRLLDVAGKRLVEIKPGNFRRLPATN